MAKTFAPLRPKSPGQRDLFQVDSLLTSEIRGERSLMALPFLALSKNALEKPLTWSPAASRSRSAPPPARR